MNLTLKGLMYKRAAIKAQKTPKLENIYII